MGDLAAVALTYALSQDSLRENEKKYRDLFENTGEALFVAQDGMIVFQNPRSIELSGYSEKEFQSKSFFDFIHEDDREMVIDHHIRRLKGEKLPQGYAFRIIHKNGNVLWAELNAVLIQWNRKPAVLCFMTNVTERKRAEEDLRQTKSILQTAMDCSPAGIAIADAPDGQLRYVNDAGLLIRGGDRRKVIKGVDVEQYVASWKLLDLDGRPLRTDEVPLARAIMFGETNRRDFIIRRKKGEDRIVTANAAPIKDETGKITAGIVVFLDITERKRAEDALTASEAWLGETMRIARVGGWKIDLLGNTLKWTDETFRIHELPTGDPPNVADAIEFYHAEDRSWVSEAVENAVVNGKGFDFEARIITAKENLIWVRSIGHVDFHEDRIVFVWGIIQDITDRKQAEFEKEKFQTQLSQAQKLESIGSLAGGIAHDFNNLLFPIIGLSEMMLDEFPPHTPEHNDIQQIYKAGKRGRKLIQQILSFSRQSEHQPIPVHIQKILKEVLKLCRATIPADIAITQDIKTDCGPVMADPTQIHQIAMNLITNAYHAVEPAGGSISIQLTEMDVTRTDDPTVELALGRYAVLSVSDTGIGIDGAIINKIFDPYFTTKEKGRGTGLGLATVYGIVKAHGGDIKVYSDVGKGATFYVYLPLLEKSQELESEKEMMTPLPTGTEHILLVDDEKAIVHLEKQMLERLGYQTSVFTSSRDALTAFKTEPSRFDLVITDMNMPNMNGMQLAEEMIGIRPDIPIILCTGFSERIDNEKAEAQGIRGLLMKPVGMNDFAEKIRTVSDEAKNESGGSSGKNERRSFP